jgi:hydroxymethylpyrimidine/phosphomethylpyrimidine kinase
VFGAPAVRALPAYPPSSPSAPSSPSSPCALAVGGLDPGGGAGIGADLRAFAAAGAFGCAAAAALTVQSTAGLRSVHPVSARRLAAQVGEVLRAQRVRAVKVGALATVENVRAVAGILSRHPEIPVVIDTPMAPTRGRGRLLGRDALGALREELVPRATLLTVNLAEAEALLGEPVRSVGEAHDAARAIAALGARAVLVKGGHLDGPMAIDVLALGGAVIELRARRLPRLDVHGTGCALASLVAGRLAVRPTEKLGDAALVAAIRWAKRVHHAALGRAVGVGEGQRVLVFPPARIARLAPPVEVGPRRRGRGPAPRTPGR